MSTKKNYLYNLFYQIFILMFPIILTPYTSRVLGTESIGIYSYIYTIVTYFIMFSNLGCSELGTRLVAKNKDNKKKLSKVFFSIYYIQLIMTFIMSILYIIFSIIFLKDNLLIALIKVLSIFTVIFDVTWFFNGLEKFKINIWKRIVIKLTSLILVIIFVKDSTDLYKYAIILSLCNLLSNIIWIKYLKKEIIYVKVKLKDIIKNIKPSLILFIPILSKTIYTSIDKLMIGNISTMNELGLYEQSEKFMRIPYIFSTSLSNTMSPRNSNLISKNKSKNVKHNIEKSFKFLMFLAFPIALGIILVSDQLIPLLLGKEFIKSSNILKILILSTIIYIFTDVINSQYLIPNELDKTYTKSIVIGTISNILLNIILIKKYASIGAAYATFLSEFIVLIYQFINVRKNLPLLKYLKISIEFLIKALIMYIICSFINIFNLSSIINIFIKVILGIVIYLLLNINFIKKEIKTLH